MQLADHYLRLRSHFAAVGEGQRIPVSLQRLADILCCTNRNANLLLSGCAPWIAGLPTFCGSRIPPASWRSCCSWRGS
ncbi:hypothetical protein G3578_12395 [Brevibacillus sp. SYP-B805]|nr:hypothetical protein [Brevibacillus sp. SYP-B805]